MLEGEVVDQRHAHLEQRQRQQPRRLQADLETVANEDQPGPVQQSAGQAARRLQHAERPARLFVWVLVCESEEASEPLRGFEPNPVMEGFVFFGEFDGRGEVVRGSSLSLVDQKKIERRNLETGNGAIESERVALGANEPLELGPSRLGRDGFEKVRIVAYQVEVL